MDAELIARFCLAQQPPAWSPPAAEVRELQALVRRLEALMEMRVAEENRLSAGGAVAAVRSSVEEHIAYLAEQIRRTEKLIRDHIDSHPGLKRQSELLDSIPGIGETTAAAFLAEVPEIKQYKSARQVAAFAGLVPRQRQSGSSIRGLVRLSKIGNGRLRKALYFPYWRYSRGRFAARNISTTRLLTRSLCPSSRVARRSARAVLYFSLMSKGNEVPSSMNSTPISAHAGSPPSMPAMTRSITG